MGFFGSKKQKNSPEKAEETTDVTTKKSSKKKKGGMSSVFKETVFEAMLDDFSMNTSFVVEKDDETCFVGMLLDTNTIGGFSKKSNKDEAKGSIIECINAGRIKALMSAELLEEESMVIIPDEFTLDAMGEFSLLTDAAYTVVYVHSDGEIEKTETAITYQDAHSIAMNAMSIQEFLHLGDEEELIPVDEDVDEEVPEASVTDEIEGYNESENVGYEDEPSGGFDPYAYEETEDSSVGYDGNSESFYESQDDASYDDTDGFEYNEEPEEELEEVPEDDVWKTIQRKFYSDDLRLEISTEPFDAQFVHGNAFVPFNEDCGDGWLDGYLSQMAHDANLELRRMHQENLLSARRKYCRLLSMYCDKISADLDTVDPNSRFGYVLQQLKASKNNALSNMDKTVSDIKADLNAKWEQKLQQVGEDAKLAAEHQYKERYGRQHDADIMNVELDVKDRIESEFNEAVTNMHNDRRKEASKMLDYGVNAALNAVSNVYLDMLKKEDMRYNEIKASMAKFIDDNRKNDIAYANTLAEQLRQTQEADTVRAELTAKIENMSAEFEAKKLSLRADLENMQRQNNEKLREKDILCEDKIHDIQVRNDELQAQLDKLIADYAALDEKKDKEYQSRVNELINERASWEDKCKHVMESNKRANRMSVILATVALIAASSIGFIIGMSCKLNDDKTEQQSAIIEEFNKAKDEIDESSKDTGVTGADNTSATNVTPNSTVTTPVESNNIAPIDNTTVPVDNQQTVIQPDTNATIGDSATAPVVNDTANVVTP